MWLRIVRTTCFAAMTVVAVPYAVALMTNILCGWPLCTNRYRRAFNPYKVFALNWALLCHLKKLRYFGLMIRWRRFYQNASRNRLIKVSITFHLHIFCHFYDIVLCRVVNQTPVNRWSVIKAMITISHRNLPTTSCCGYSISAETAIKGHNIISTASLCLVLSHPPP